jgi:integrase
MHKLFSTVSTLDGAIGEHLARDWWAALVLVAWDSGERIGAILGLTWNRVDLKDRWVRFAAEYRKGGSDDSAVQISRETAQALDRIRGGRGPVFPWPYSHTYLWQRFGKILRLAELDDGPRSKFHRIRRSVASHAEAAGGNATAMLRHSKREITEAYLDPTIVKPQQPSDVLFRLAK